MQLLLATSPRLRRPDGGELPLAPRDAALLAWLALEGPTPRNRLAALLWPDSAPEAARNTLRQRLFQLKKLCGDGLVAGQATLHLGEGVTHDLADADGVLADTALDIEGEFAQWLALQRQRRSARLRQAVCERADRAEAARDWRAALAHAQELLVLEPLSEPAHRRLIRLHYLAGDRAAALLAFDRCERVLKDEVGARPSAETLALLHTLEQAAAPVPAGPGAVPASVLRPPRLVGRDAEWAQLLQQFQAGGVLLLAGEAGMGKSRLLGDLALREGAAAALASARPGDQTVPFALLARLLRAVLRPRQQGSGLAAGAAQALHPPQQLRELARLLPELGEPPAQASALGLQQALEAVLLHARQQGLAGLLVDDLHFADAASLEALQGLLGAVPGLAWVLAGRAAELSPAGLRLTQAAERDHACVALTLAPLGLAGVAALVNSLALAGYEGEPLAPALLRHTGGNPLYLLETLKAMLVQPAAAQAAPAAAAGAGALPTARNVAQLVGQRLGGLTPAALKLARCAAVAGQDFSTTLATQVLGADPLDLADAWAELEQAQVLRDAAFAHDLIHEAALASVPPVLARRLHALIAQALVAQAAPVQRVAAHWLASDQPHQAAPWLLQAGRQAAAALRPAESCEATLQAADLLQAQGRQAEAREALIELLQMLYSPNDEHAQAVLARLDQLADTPLERARVAQRRADLLARSGDFAGAGRVARVALDHLDAQQHPALAAELLCNAAAGDLAEGDADRALERVHRANDLAARSGHAETEATVAGYLGSVLDHADRMAEAYLVHRRCYELARQFQGSPIQAISAASNLAGNRNVMGQFDAALEMVQQCWRLAGDAAIDLPSQWPAIRFQQALAQLGLGLYTQAQRSLEDARQDIGRHMPGWMPAVDNLVAVLWMHLGQWARARQAVQAALDGAPATLHRYRARSLRLSAEIAAALNEPARLPPPRQLDELVQRAGLVAGHQHGLAQVPQLAPDEGYALAQRLRREAAGRQMPPLVLEAETRCADAALRAGLHERAAAHAREALDRLREVLPTSMYRGEVWLAAARALQGPSPDEARAVLQQALAWVRDTAAGQVPAEFRASFLHRNLANRELQALAARLRD
jgi:DNA-binding SARP family transcriptional activator